MQGQLIIMSNLDTVFYNLKDDALTLFMPLYMVENFKVVLFTQKMFLIEYLDQHINNDVKQSLYYSRYYISIMWIGYMMINCKLCQIGKLTKSHFSFMH